MDFVILEVIRELQKRDDGFRYYVFVAEGADHCITNSEWLTVIELKSSFYPYWEQVSLPRAVKKWKIDLLHCTSNTAPVRCAVPLVLTLHDIIYLTSSKDKRMSRYQQLGWYYRRWNIPHIVDKCRRIITVSHTERSNILSRFPQLASKLSVVYNGYNPHFTRTPYVGKSTRRYLEEQQYLLFMGSNDSRKNTLGVLQAYHIYRERSKAPLKLIVTGLKQPAVEAMLRANGWSDCAPYIVYPGYVPGDDLPALYNGAFAFLFPSFLEGFGIPIIEAMACGTPVITSNVSAMPEVAGAGGILIDPTQPEAIAEAVLHLEEDTHYYWEQVTYGLTRCRRFSWKLTTEAYVKIYKSIITPKEPASVNEAISN
jgi:glycosyltransferase involved in cell wall biosynthesis